MHVSQVYVRFSPRAGTLFRQTMNLAAKHRVLRVHHLIAAAGDGRSCLCTGAPHGSRPLVPMRWTEQATQLCEQETAGCLDSPVSNSPTMRRVLNLAADRAGHDIFPVFPAHLLAMAACCWNEEQPAGLELTVRVRSEIRRLCFALGVEPLPAFQSPSDTQKIQATESPSSDAMICTPSVEELEAMIGPPVTDDDLLRLYMEMKAADDPEQREWLAWKLSYLRDRG